QVQPCLPGPPVKIRLVRLRCFSVPGAHLLANIASEGPVPKSGVKRLGDALAVFDCVVGDAAVRIDHTGFHNRVCRTGVYAEPARPALIHSGRVRLYLHRCDDGGEKEIGTQSLAQHEAVLPNPPDPRAHRPSLFHYRTRINGGVATGTVLESGDL